MTAPTGAYFQMTAPLPVLELEAALSAIASEKVPSPWQRRAQDDWVDESVSHHSLIFCTHRLEPPMPLVQPGIVQCVSLGPRDSYRDDIAEPLSCRPCVKS